MCLERLHVRLTNRVYNSKQTGEDTMEANQSVIFSNSVLSCLAQNCSSGSDKLKNPVKERRMCF